ncbi:MAG: type II toxin-antitoxin system Phd/YefM family antitoxin [Candidatus Sulfotelmatobacter sp.]
MAKVLTVSYVRKHWGKVLRRVERGERIIMSRRGQQIAAIVPVRDLELLGRSKRKRRKSLSGKVSG